MEKAIGKTESYGGKNGGEWKSKKPKMLGSYISKLYMCEYNGWISKFKATETVLNN